MNPIDIIIIIVPTIVILLVIGQGFLCSCNCSTKKEDPEENLASINNQEHSPLLTKGQKKSVTPNHGCYDFVHYGFDGAWVYHRLCILFVIFLGIGFSTFYGLRNTPQHHFGRKILSSALGASASILEIMFLMALSTLFLKYFIRTHIVSVLKLRGDEKVLDIACGRGFIMSGVAKKLENGGKVIGVDIFDASIQSGNGMEVTLGNMQKLGLEDRVEVQYGFAQDLKQFSDNTFDCITVNFMIPYLNTENRKKAFSEWNRVLKPGGIFVSSDMPWAAPDIRGQLEELGFDVTTYFPHLYHFLPAIVTSGRKSSAKSGKRSRTWKSYAIYLVFLLSLIPWAGVFVTFSLIPVNDIVDLL